jgi:membrane-associated phospholipid phosphatase
MKTLRVCAVLFSVLPVFSAFSQDLDSTYQLRKNDILYPVSGGFLFGASLVFQNTKYQDYCEPSPTQDVPWFDKPALKYYNPGLDNIGGIALYLHLISPILLYFGSNRDISYRNVVTASVLYAECLFLSFSLTEFVKTSTQRQRPYVYKLTSSTAEKTAPCKPDMHHSFYSHHASLTFCSAVFCAKTFYDLQLSAPLKYSATAGLLLSATAISISRFYSGEHFPSDIITGALIGSCIGYLIPELHRIRNRRSGVGMKANGLYVYTVW